MSAGNTTWTARREEKITFKERKRIREKQGEGSSKKVPKKVKEE